jgi:hypothetical protein
MSRYRLTDDGVGYVKYFFAEDPDVDEHFHRGLPEQSVEVRGTSAQAQFGDKQKGERLLVKGGDTKASAIKEEVKEINRFLSGVRIEGGIHWGYKRVFNNVDDPRFDWNMGGRLHSVGVDSYQSLPKAERLEMTIDGEPVAEIDVSSSQLAILHGLTGQPLDTKRDLYDLEGIDRGIVKSWSGLAYERTSR